MSAENTSRRARRQHWLQLRPQLHSDLVLIAGGSGISAVLSVLHEALMEPRIKTIQVHVYSSLVLQNELTKLESARVQVSWYAKGERPATSHFERCFCPIRRWLCVAPCPLCRAYSPSFTPTLAAQSTRLGWTIAELLCCIYPSLIVRTAYITREVNMHILAYSHG